MTIGRRAALVAALMLGGCGADPGGYPLSVKAAHDRLLAADPIPFRRTVQCGILIYFHPYSTSDGEVAWEITSEGSHMLTFRAKIVAIDVGHSRVSVEVVPTENGKSPYDGSTFYPRPAVRMPFQPAAVEWVDSILAGRSIDAQKFGPRADNNSVCEVQEGGLESGHVFHADTAKEDLQ